MENKVSNKKYLTVELVTDVFFNAVREDDDRFSFLDESYEMFRRVKEMNFLDDASKCVLGLALMYWSIKSDSMPYAMCFKRNHDFAIHNFYENASSLEDDLRSVFGESFVPKFMSSAKFINDEFDAAFCIVNSMSCGFNVGFIKRFGGDRHMQWLAALFNYMVGRMYVGHYGDCDSGFGRYVDDLNSMTYRLDWINRKTSNRLYARFMMWCRKRLSVASKILGTTFQPALLEQTRRTALMMAMNAYQEDDQIWRDETSAHGKKNQTGKIGHKKNKKQTTQNHDVSKNVDTTDDSGFIVFDKDDTGRRQSENIGSYSYMFTVCLNGNRTTFRKKTSHGTWIVSGKGAEDPKHLEELRTLGYLPDGFTDSYIIEEKKGL